MKIEILAKVVEVSEVGVKLELVKRADGDESISPIDGLGHVFVACDDAETLRTFGALFGLDNGVCVTVEATVPS